MSTRIFLVRHGATTLTADDRFAGSTDVPLGPEGRVQVERLAERLIAAPITTVYSSPLRRKEFHNVVLSAGSVPLTVLERQVDTCIARKKTS